MKTQTQLGAPSVPGNGSPTHISLHFAPGPSAATSARNALHAIEGRVDSTVMEDLRLLVTELVTNSVRHSRAGGDNAVELAIDLRPGTIHVEVTDRGTGFEPRPRQPGQSKAGGWGLYLVEKLADRWGVICNHATRVWFEIDRPPVPAGR